MTTYSPPAYRLRHTYYKEHHGLALKKIADHMMASRVNAEIFCAPLSMSPSSIVIYISQATHWLIDFMDIPNEQRVYSLWRKQVRVVALRDRVRIEWKTVLHGMTREILATVPVNSKIPLMRQRLIPDKNVRSQPNSRGEWLEAFDAFVSGEIKEKTLIISDVRLNVDDMVYVKSSLVGSDDIRAVALRDDLIHLERKAK